MKLLRLLQEREFRPVGGSEKPVRTDSPFIFATRAAGFLSSKLREDLLLSSIRLRSRNPPLRERPEDISLFCDHFLAKFARQHERPIQGIHSAARDALLRVSWPGNVRELSTCWNDRSSSRRERRSTLRDLPEMFQQSPSSPVPRGAITGQFTFAEIERLAILQALRTHQWQQARGGEHARHLSSHAVPQAQGGTS